MPEKYNPPQVYKTGNISSLELDEGLRASFALTDGVALTSMAHPRPRWYMRPYWAFRCQWAYWFGFRRNVETIQISVKRRDA